MATEIKNKEEEIQDEKKDFRGKGKGNNSRRRGKGRTSRGSKRGCINDASYYYSDPTVLRQVMNFSFNQFGGVPVTLDELGYDHLCKVNVPMIMTIYLNPALPPTPEDGDFVSGVTTASLRNFLMLSSGNMKSTVYAPQDITILQLAVGEVVKMASYITRIFGVLPLFNYRNRTYPETLIKAMGIDADDFFSNAADYRVRFNRLLTLASKIPFPASMPALLKDAQLYANIYLDDDNSALSQSYMFVPGSTWILDEEIDPNGPYLADTLVVSAANDHKLSYVLDIFEQQISALTMSDSLNYIYSDILRLISTGTFKSVITFSAVPEGYINVPVYNTEIKDWVHNATIMGEPDVVPLDDPDAITYTNQNSVRCDANKNLVVYRPRFTMSCPGGNNMLIDFDHDQVTDEDKVAATRLSARWKITETGVEETPYQVLNGEFAVLDSYISNIAYFTGVNDTSNNLVQLDHTFIDCHDEAMNARRIARLCATFDKFDWHPMVYFTYPDSTDPVLGMTGDLNFYTDLAYEELKDIYDYEIIHLLQIN